MYDHLIYNIIICNMYKWFCLKSLPFQNPFKSKVTTKR